MIAPEGIRDGQHFAKALYTFAGEGVEDLPFKKGDMIEVLDCADANWWRGKNLSTDEDGLFPACLVKFTNAPAHQDAMKTTERLARLSDVLTPSYMKQQSKSTDANGSQQDGDPNDANSIESLLLNLADNEMQVQQQKVQAHMPRKPTRMKLLYEDHSNAGSAGRSSSMSTSKDVSPKQKQQSANPQAPQLPTPNFQKKKSQPQVDLSLSQAGIWGAPFSTQSSNGSNSISQLFTNSSFTSSMESMRDATQRTEDATRNRNSGSMLFGPRVMPDGSRSSSRTQQNSSVHSEQNTMRSHDVLSHLDSNPSLASLYSMSDASDTVARESHAAHQQAISEARQLMDGIPSPTEFGSGGSHPHEAEYLFSDNDNEHEIDNDSDAEAAIDSSKFNTMMSPSSENSARFVSYSSTVSSLASDVSESQKSKRLPAIPSSTNLSLVSDTSSVGLAGQSSTGDLAHLHRSWYSSTESLNLLGGGASLKSPGVDAYNADDLDSQQDTHAPRMTKHKSRLRPAEGTLRHANADTISAALSTAQNGKQDAPNNIVSNFQHMMNISASTQSGHIAATAADVRPVSSIAGPYPSYVGVQDGPYQHISNGGIVPPVQATQVSTAYQPSDPYSMAASGAPSGVPTNGAMQQSYAHAGYTGVDANGRPMSAYQQPYIAQRPMSTANGGMVYNAPPAGMSVSSPGQLQEGYAHLGVPLSVGPMYSQQQQPQVIGAVVAAGQAGSHNSLGPYPTGISVQSVATSIAAGYASAGPVPSPSMPIAAGGRPRSYTAGTDHVMSGSRAYSPVITAQQQQPPQQQQQQQQQQQYHQQPLGIPQNTSQLRSSSSANGISKLGTESDIKNKLAQNYDKQQGGARPASYGGTGSVMDSSIGTMNKAQRPGTPDSAQSSMRGSTINRGAVTPTGFGTVSTTPTLSFMQREGRMSPFPSNVGASQSPSLSGATISDVPKAPYVDELDPQLMLPLPENITPINYVKMTRPVFKFGGHISHPETINWSKVDRQMTMLKSVSAKLTVDVLATMHVGRPFNKPIERIRAAFVWIASNIQYDASTAENNDEFERQEAPSAVLQRRRSRGPGFAYLFDAMMGALAIESHTIRGYLRQPLDTCHGPVLPAANHVWNVVCLDGEYRLIDTACAAKSHPLNAEYTVDSWFFLVSPKEAIFTHFPLSPEEQFVDPIVTLPIFWMLPYVRPMYFQSKVKLLNLPLMPRIELKDDQAIPLVLCLRDSTLSVFAEIELHDPNGSGRIVARQPLLAQCMDYKGKRMVKVLVGVRATDTRGLLKIYCGTRVPLQPKKPGDPASQQSAAGKAQKVFGFLHGKDRRTTAHDYSRVQDVDEEGNIRTVATAKTFPLACALHVVHRGRNNAATFVQPNAAAPNEFYIKEPTSAQLHLGESIGFHLLPVGDERLFHLQLRSPSGQQHKFVYQPSDQGYILRHTVKERGAWIIVYHSDAEGWLPIASYQCV
ncbi:hypothetical protein IW140_001905 [Coemansia sp. RSA 1813]|nr:hypothetical protein LPJ74_003633 [Coemansia sp. RSA 1843]KAJ2212088.1 hypothetical protein EV179_004950 [Coemansia sp. RSA 487]KAJ2570951.1 hypothetical protein IW140_001905 [Coemansia sp. RSA 1813]